MAHRSGLSPIQQSMLIKYAVKQCFPSYGRIKSVDHRPAQHIKADATFSRKKKMSGNDLSGHSTSSASDSENLRTP